MFIYLITNTITGKNYVGQTKRTIEARFKSHLREAKNQKYSMYLHNSIRKYGEEHFTVIILEECSAEQVHEREKFWIKHLNTKEPFGYNEHEGGRGGCLNASPPLRKKLSDAKLGTVPWNKGLTKETDPRVSKNVPWNKGLTKDTDPRVAKCAEGISKSSKGKSKSESHIESMRIAKRKRRGASLTEGTPKTSE